MAIAQNTFNPFRIGAASCLFFTSLSFASIQVDYSSTMGDGKWRMSGNPLRCGLAITIPDYGIGYFEQFATKEPHFILRKWQELEKSLPAQVIAKSPVWKPGGLAFLVTRTSIKPGEYGVYLDREPALKLLTYLSQGYEANFNYQTDQGFSITVVLSPIRFKKVFSRYQQCLGSLLTFNFDNVKETVFHFDSDSKELTDTDKEQLHRIAQYVAVDEQIEKIRVWGYADGNGRKGYNNAISEYRAEAIKKYLLKIGVPKKKLTVTWFGALKPVARNDTDDGRAANRRVVVDLLKK